MSDPPSEFEPQLSPDHPDLPGKVIVFESPEAAIDMAIRELQVVADAAVRERGRFHLAVSGDPILEPVWDRLMLDPDLRMFPWPDTHLWILEADNHWPRMHESLITPAGIPPEHVHPMPTDTGGEASAQTPPMSHDLAARPLDAVLVGLTPDECVQDQAGEWTVAHAARTIRIVAAASTWEPAIIAIQTNPATSLATLTRNYRGDLRWYLAKPTSPL